MDIQALRTLGVPFWMAGGYGNAEKLREAAPVTAVLGLLAIAVVLLIGIPLGIEAGLRPGSPFEVTTPNVLIFCNFPLSNN